MLLTLAASSAEGQWPIINVLVNGQVLPSGPGFDDDNNLKLFVELFHAARHKITIANPYFVPDESLMVAITSAAQRGVDVLKHGCWRAHRRIRK